MLKIMCFILFIVIAPYANAYSSPWDVKIWKFPHSSSFDIETLCFKASELNPLLEEPCLQLEIESLGGVVQYLTFLYRDVDKKNPVFKFYQTALKAGSVTINGGKLTNWIVVSSVFKKSMQKWLLPQEGSRNKLILLNDIIK